MNWYTAAMSKYGDFEGRACRKEYWIFYSVNTSMQLAIMVGAITVLNLEPDVAQAIASVLSLGVLLPSLAVTVRRLHDTNRTGWWILIGLIPLVGPLVLLVFLAQGSRDPGNRYGTRLDVARVFE